MIDHIDHVVLTTRDLAACLKFYSEILRLDGPVIKTGAVHKLRSVYVRDPDLNLVEISVAA